MSAGMDWRGGLEALARECDTLPDQLIDDVVDPRMEAEVEAGAARMRGAYEHESLASGVRIDKRGPGDYRIRNVAPHAHLHDLGTVARQHSDGKSTGTMPANPVLVPEAIEIRERIDSGVSQDLGKLKSAVFEVKP